MHLLVFGPGYTASRLIAAVDAEVTRVDRALLADEAAVAAAIAGATHILSSVPPDGDTDPVLARYAAALSRAPARWVGYLSSTGVYGDAGGAWVDESAPLAGRRGGRMDADRAWAALHPAARVFRLPGIYGPGRSTLDRVREGRAHRIVLAGQVFSRVHVDDIVAALVASFDGPAGVYNIADDEPASQNAVVETAAALLGLAPPPRLSLDEAGLSPQARAFYAENRRVANGRAKRQLGWRPRYPSWREGLRALMATASPASARAAPTTAATLQR